MCIASVLWGKIVQVIRVESWEVFPKYLRNGLEHSDQTLHADRYDGWAGAGSQEFMTFCIDAAWERGEVYGFLLSFRTLDYVLALHAAPNWRTNFVWKFGYEIPNGCAENEGYTLIFGIFYT